MHSLVRVNCSKFPFFTLDLMPYTIYMNIHTYIHIYWEHTLYSFALGRTRNLFWPTKKANIVKFKWMTAVEMQLPVSQKALKVCSLFSISLFCRRYSKNNKKPKKRIQKTEGGKKHCLLFSWSAAAGSAALLHSQMAGVIYLKQIICHSSEAMRGSCLDT